MPGDADQTTNTGETNLLEVIDQHGRIVVLYAVSGVALSLQDGGKTLKVFCRSHRTPPQERPVVVDVQELRRLARDATPGPWQFDVFVDEGEGRTIPRILESNWPHKPLGQPPEIVAFDDTHFHRDLANAYYLSMLDPATVISILDRMEAAEAEVERLQTETSRHASSEVSKEALSKEAAVEISRLRSRLDAAEAACSSYWEWEYGTTHDGGPDPSLLVKWKAVADAS